MSDELALLKSQQPTTEDDSGEGSSQKEKSIKVLENKLTITLQKWQEVESKISEMEASMKSKNAYFLSEVYSSCDCLQVKLHNHK